MKARWISLGVAIGLGLALTVGFAVASGSSGPAGRGVGSTAAASQSTDWLEAMDAMHDSPFMEQMRAQMGPEWAARCDALHEQMRERFGQTGSGMMGAGHGPGDGTGYGPGSGPADGTGYGPGPGGMMGSGNRMMGS